MLGTWQWPLVCHTLIVAICALCSSWLQLGTDCANGVTLAHTMVQLFLL